jgi:group I intron endonuclease
MPSSKSFGIYTIRNTVNGKLYVGSTRKNFSHRWTSHRSDLRRNTHHSPKLQHAWNKYGMAAFEFIVLEILKDKDHVLDREQLWINLLDPEYNIVRNIFDNSRLRAGQLKAAAKRAKTYVLASPDGEIHHIHNLRKFCREHGFAYKNVHSVITGWRFHYQGWVVPRETPESTRQYSKLVTEHGWSLRRIHAFIDPEGNHIQIDNLKAFCRDHGLNYKCMSMVNRGRIQCHRGWRKP